MNNNFKLLVFFLSLSLSAVVFQNCSKVGFERLPQEAVLESTNADPEPIAVEPPVEIPETPDQAPQVYSKTLNLAPAEKAEGDLNILLLIDDSKSNIENIERMLLGIKDLMDSLKGQKFTIVAHTIGRSSDSFPLFQTVSVKVNATTTRQENDKGKELARASESLPAADFIEKIRSHLSVRRAASDNEVDSSPDYVCGLLAYYNREFNLKPSLKQRFVTLVISDEDSQASLSTRSCLKESTIEREDVGSKTYTRVPIEVQTTLEGGEMIWRNSTLSFTDIATCDLLTKSKIDARLSTLGSKYRPTSRTYTGCSKTTSTQTRVISQKRKLYFGPDNSDAVTALAQLQSFNSMVPKINFFFGGFVVTKESEKTNKDQDIGTRHMLIAKEGYSEYGTKFYPISETKYSDFVDDVINFEIVTKKNHIELSQIVAPSEVDKIKIKAVYLLSSQGVPKEIKLPFSQVADRILITDPNFDLSLGAVLQFEFTK